MNERIIGIIAIILFAAISAILGIEAIICLSRFSFVEASVNAFFGYLFGYASANLYVALKRHNNGN